MGELGVGRGQIELLAALLHADAHNDVAPSAYNEDDPSGGLPASPPCSQLGTRSAPSAPAGSDLWNATSTSPRAHCFARGALLPSGSRRPSGAA